MARTPRWIAVSLAGLLALLGGGALVVWLLLPSDEQLAADLAARFEQATGTALDIGGVHWSLRPMPVVVLSELATRQPQPLTVRRIVLKPQLAALWSRRVAIDEVEIEGAALQRAPLRVIAERWREHGGAESLGTGGWKLADIPLRSLRLRDIVWTDRRGIALAYDADGWRPREAQVRRPGAPRPATLRIEREGEQDRWQVRIDVGGGTWNGEATLQAQGNDRLRLAGRLEPKDIDVAALLASFGRRSALEGRFHGETTFSAEAETMTGLPRALRTRTRFTVQPATLLGFDLTQAVRGAPRKAGDRTVLDSVTGTLDTRATGDGTALRYRDLKARSGVLSASGSGTLYHRRLDGEAAVDIVDGVIGVPLKLGGTLDDPQLSLTGGALAGAAVGTAVLPGVGTAIGARIGQQLEKLFGDADEEPTPKAKDPPASGRRPETRQ
jgi:uncharacterized protein involved in outer membrane biogenesis